MVRLPHPVVQHLVVALTVAGHARLPLRLQTGLSELGGTHVNSTRVATLAADLRGEHSARRIRRPCSTRPDVHVLLRRVKPLVAVLAAGLERPDHPNLTVPDRLVALLTVDFVLGHMGPVDELRVLVAIQPTHVTGKAPIPGNVPIALDDLEVALLTADPHLQIRIMAEDEPLAANGLGGRPVAGRASPNGLCLTDALEMA